MNGGVLRGVGKPVVGAVCSLLGYYVIGTPIGVSLMFAADMGILGKKAELVCRSASWVMKVTVNSSLVFEKDSGSDSASAW